MLPLITRTRNSFGRSLQDYKDVVDRAVQMGAPSVAITDVHNLSAVPAFLEYCKEKSIHGIAGMTLNVSNGDDINGELVLLAKGDDGLQALTDLHHVIGDVGDDSKFNSARYLSWQNLIAGDYDKALKHCVALDGFPGSLCESLMQSQNKMMVANDIQEAFDDPRSLLSTLRYRFSPDDYLGVKPIGQSSALASVLSSTPDGDGHIRQRPSCAVEVLVGYAKNEAQLNQSKALLAFYSKDYLEKKISGNNPEEAHKKITRVINKKYANFHLASAGEQYQPSPANFIDAETIIKRCPSPTNILRRGIEFDVFGDETLIFEEKVRTLWSEFKEFLPPEEVANYQKALIEEVKTVKNSGFENYYINIFKFYALAKENANDMMLRGSGVGSLVFYMAGISAVDPVKEGLLYSRFLSPFREEDPDADMDIAYPGEMLSAMREGRAGESFGTIMSYIGVKSLEIRFNIAKSALVDYYDMSPENKAAAERFTKMFIKRIDREKSDLSVWLEKSWINLPEDVRTSPVARALVGIAENMGDARISANRSSTGVVLSNAGFNHYPQIDAKENPWPSIAYDKKELEPIGLVKYDFLANRHLTRNVNALRAAGLPSDKKVSVHDPVANYVFSRGALLGLTQMNGFMAPKIFEQVKPRNFYEISAMSAMLRDGGDPKFQEIIDQYVQGKQNPEGVKLPDVAKPILSETYGSLYYEEQLLKLMVDIGGLTMEIADRLRSGIKKKKYERIDEMRGPFIEGAMRKSGISEEDATILYGLVEAKRGRFLFSKAHSMAYAALCMKEVWTKANHPAEFYAECLMDKRFIPSKFLSVTEVKEDDADVTAKMVNRIATMLHDWKKINRPSKGVDNDAAKRFISCVGNIAVRDIAHKDRNTARNYDTIKSAFDQYIDMGGFDFIIPEGSDRNALKAHNMTVFSDVNAKVINISAPKSSNSTKGRPVENAPGNGNVSQIQVDGENEPALNRRGKRYLNYQDFKSVPFPSMLEFLHNERMLTLTETREDGGGRAVYHFSYEDDKGNAHHEKVKAISTDPAKMGEYSAPIAKAMFQGGSKNQTSLTSQELFYYIVSIKHKEGWPEPVMKEGSSRFFEMTYDKEDKDSANNKQNQAFTRAAHKLIIDSSFPLHDEQSMGIVTRREMFEPSAPVINDKFLFKSAREKSEAHIEKLFEKSRSIPRREIELQMADGSLSASKSWSDNWITPKGKKAFRKTSLEPLSNHRLVSDTIPLYAMQPNPGVGIAEGGHQRFFFNASKGRAGKMDLNRTTKNKRGAVCGRIQQGAETLWLTEATIDTFSFNELQLKIQEMKARRPDMQKVAFAEPNSLSVRSAGMAEVFIEQLLSIKVIKPKSDSDPVDFYEVTKDTLPKDMADGTKESIVEWFSERTVHWYSDGTDLDHEAKTKLATLMQAAGMSEAQIKKAIVTHVKNGNDSASFSIQNIFKNNINSEKDSFLCALNLDNWLNCCGLDVVKDENGVYHAGDKNNDVKKGPNFLSMTETEKRDVQRKLQSKFQTLTGARSIGMALDADIKNGVPGAGRIDAQITADVCRLIGIPVGMFMPEPKPGRTYDINGSVISTPKDAEGNDEGLKDHNDYLMFITELEKAGGQNAADEVLMEYASALVKPKLTISIPAPTARVNNVIR
ncbi:MAG: hypothetical protein CBC55_01430 [Gammaproteobacteria bacterium TMED95]|nr:MAG: hypothetical protein CBC55_01430 [Gammaproteobacteria bacterium TMED95]|tara:strand:- start:7679 stop:12592 length:4914 start_codon:yes stop_codon:yes gene_type:complete